MIPKTPPAPLKDRPADFDHAAYAATVTRCVEVLAQEWGRFMEDLPSEAIPGISDQFVADFYCLYLYVYDPHGLASAITNFGQPAPRLREPFRNRLFLWKFRARAWSYRLGWAITDAVWAVRSRATMGVVIALLLWFDRPPFRWAVAGVLWAWAITTVLTLR